MTTWSMQNTNSKVAFLFPGQGSQSVGMGKELAEKFPIAKRTFEEADEALGYKLSRVCFEGPEEQLGCGLPGSGAAWSKAGLGRRTQPGRIFGACCRWDSQLF
jgi:malonyl CoA-acyl carrier protein transacylase